MSSQVINVRGTKLADEGANERPVRHDIVRCQPDDQIARREIGRGKHKPFKDVIQRAANDVDGMFRKRAGQNIVAGVC